ncbi:MAG: succinylglutamate desuccinylase/aspartoacylase family protein [Patescibacteria group bacterium]
MKKTKQKINHSFIKILTGSDLSYRRLALMSAKSKNPGPVVWLTGCIHGDEVGGIAVIQEVFKKIKNRPLLRGSLFAFPLMNPVGFEMVSRNLGVVQEDLNRSFPGDKNGSLVERITDKIFTTILKTKPNLVLDLHNDWLQSIPYTIIDPYPGNKYREAYEKTKKLSLHTGFLVIDEGKDPEEDKILKKTLSGSLIRENIPALTIELGGAYTIDEKIVAEGVKSIFKLLKELGMSKESDNNLGFSIPPKLRNKILKYSHQPVVSTSGIIRFIVKPGQVVKKKQVLARVYNVFGELKETLFATNDCVILGHADSAVALPGEAVIACGVI